MKKNTFALILPVLLMLSTFTRSQVSQEWMHRFDYNESGNNDVPSSMAIDESNNIYIAGTAGPIGNTDIVTVKYDPAGQPVWTRAWNALNNSNDGAHDMMIKGDAIYITGFTEVPPMVAGNRRKDFATLKYSLDGTLLWVSTYNFSPTDNWEDIAYAIDVDLQDNVYVTGSSKGDSAVSGYRDIAVVKYNSAGEQLWVQRYNAPCENNATGIADDIPTDLEVDELGNVHITGFSVGAGTGNDYVTLKYNSSGVSQWIRRYTLPGVFTDAAYALELDDLGNVYVTGGSSAHGTNPAMSYDYATVKYSSSGEELWSKRFNSIPGGNSVAWDEARDIAVDNAGNVYVTGFSPSVTAGTFGDDFYTIKYNPQGIVVWESRWDALGYEDKPKKIKVDAQGNCFLTGFSTNPDASMSLATIKIDNNGVVQWSQTYQGESGNQHKAHDIVLDHSGGAFVTGQSFEYGDDYVTLKYGQPLGVNETSSSNQIVAYPNPASDILNIKGVELAGIIDLKVTNSLGQAVMNEQHLNSNISLDTSSLAMGVYLLTITSGTNTTLIKFQKS